MLVSERMAALERLGYDRDEARFLSIAALQSGYFLRRQYLRFIDGTKGWKDVLLLRKLESRGHCQVIVGRHRRMLYHLSSKALYDALGESNNRNRRGHQPSTIKNRIMSLDFILEHPGSYLSTEREKLDYFRDRKVKIEDLPVRWYESPRGHPASAKYFADMYPVSIANGSEESALVQFCYVDEGLKSTDRFKTYLKQYRRLFDALRDVSVIYVSQDDHHFARARTVFDECSGAIRPISAASSTDVPAALLAYFEMRREYEARDLSRFDTARLIHYREAKARFATAEFEGLYRRWLLGGTTGRSFLTKPAQSTVIGRLRFSTCILEHDYDLFGTLTSTEPRSLVAGEHHTEESFDAF